MDWHARACEPVSVRRLCPTKVQRVLSESLIRFVPRGSYPGEKTERPRKRKRERGKGRGGENLAERTFRNSKWTAVSDVGATEVRKYFSTFVTRPVYWFRQIVVERGSEIRDARRQRDAGREGKGRRKGGKEEGVLPTSECIGCAQRSSEIDAMMGCRDFGRGSRKLWPDEYGLASGRGGGERRGWRGGG